MSKSKSVPMANIGQPQPRIDGSLKVSGKAMYTSDHYFPGMLYGVPVCATIANGEIRAMDLSVATKMPGVREIFHRKNLGKLFRAVVNPITAPEMSYVDEHRAPFEDDVVRYYGQYVALVVADTWENATAAAQAVKVTYAEKKPNVDPHLTADTTMTVESERGDSEKAFGEGAVKVDQTYVSPPETHNPIELHSSVAVWDGDEVTLYETTQGVNNHQTVLAQMLGVPQGNVRVISKFLGSGFGGKLFPWPQSPLAAAAARQLQKPVKIVVTRKMMFQNVGHRPLTQQRVRVSATADGKLTSLQQDYLNHTSLQDDYHEDCGEATAYLYSVPNLRVTWALSRRNVGAPTPMRGPGAVPGLWATESALDELAIALKMDPVKLRLANEPSMDESLKIPFSSRHMRECLEMGAEKFGWANRDAAVGSMKRDGLTVGWGMSGCSWQAERFAAHVRVELRDDGTARVSCATQDIGTGTYTVMAQIASDKLELPIERVQVVLGDTTLPPGPLSGGSMSTASVIPALMEALRGVVESLLALAAATPASPVQARHAAQLAYRAGRVSPKNDTNVGTSFQDILRAANVRTVSGLGSSTQTFGEAKPKVSMHSYGVQFAEVTWQPEIARLRVSRTVTVIDGGRIINPLAGKNQIEGAVTMGIGMALLEHTTYDPRNGAPINSNLADYLVATNADVPKLEVHFLDYPDTALDELGARGIGEIGLAGVAPAIANAVHHATGVRVRQLPIKIENLLG
ncbi:MAG TPA: xanthine dehydrogenase family protein molybdopterin-binding subunit [Gemmatimonadaceae bacterium]